ncbi:carboxypeptidase-like regulatory domain-containing protein [Maioricimonas sp. JC845]|uniref:carboxypeptidase-like regulatory domain-containing protein n=1 Tax=Maioricimonas sp. JC845 TaxID=3232138 RepID=UPI00345ACE38
MKKASLIGKLAAGLACFGTIMPAAPTFAAGPTPVVRTAQHTAVVDVALSADGSLKGQFVDHQGQPIDGAVVKVHQDGREIATVTTDAQGVYSVENLHGGVYEVAAGNSRQAFRVWSTNAAPPASRSMATIVARGDVVRGQDYYNFGYLEAALLGTAIGGLTVGVVTLSDVNDLEDKINKLQSP